MLTHRSLVLCTLALLGVATAAPARFTDSDSIVPEESLIGGTEQDSEGVNAAYTPFKDGIMRMEACEQCVTSQVHQCYTRGIRSGTSGIAIVQYPTTHCPESSNLVVDVASCKALAENNGLTWMGVLEQDQNWINGCFEWYPNKGDPVGTSKKVYYNHRAAAQKGHIGGHRICEKRTIAPSTPGTCAVLSNIKSECPPETLTWKYRFISYTRTVPILPGCIVDHLGDIIATCQIYTQGGVPRETVVGGSNCGDAEDLFQPCTSMPGCTRV